MAVFWYQFSSYSKRVDENREYFLVNGTLWQYNINAKSLIKSDDKNEMEYLEQDKHSLLGDKPLLYVKNTYTLPTQNNKFNQFLKAKNTYFEKFNSKVYDNRDIYGDNFYNFHGLPNFLPKKDTANALFDGSELGKLYLARSNETLYTGYEYYPIDDSHIYVTVYYQQFENKEVEYNDMKKNYYGEYFIIDGKVMVYDSKSMDLVESSSNSDILTYFNITKKAAQNKMTVPSS